MPSPAHRRRRAALRLITLSVLLLLLAGCAGLPPDPHEALSKAELTRSLLALGPKADAAEAALLADTALRRARSLAAEYHLVRPPWLHNTLVNTRLRRRGLCYHWAEDLKASLTPLPLQAFELHWGVAHLRTRREHNSVVVTLRGQPFHEGLVLDGWRGSGRLVWHPVRSDRYPWVLLPP